MKLIILESPCGAPAPEQFEKHRLYAAACLRDAISRGESPYASHVMLAFSGALDDASPDERRTGIGAGYDWWEAASAIVFYLDLGMSSGMQRAWEWAERESRAREERKLGAPWSEA